MNMQPKCKDLAGPTQIMSFCLVKVQIAAELIKRRLDTTIFCEKEGGASRQRIPVSVHRLPRKSSLPPTLENCESQAHVTKRTFLVRIYGKTLKPWTYTSRTCTYRYKGYAWNVTLQCSFRCDSRFTVTCIHASIHAP